MSNETKTEMEFALLLSDGSIKSVRDASFRGKHFSDLVWESLDEEPDVPLLYDTRDGKWYTRRQVKTSAARVTTVLQELGVKDGDNVYCCCSDSALAVSMILGIAFAGASYAAGYLDQTEEQLMDEVSRLKSKVVVCSPENVMTAARVVEKVSDTKALIVLSTESMNGLNGNSNGHSVNGQSNGQIKKEKIVITSHSLSDTEAAKAPTVIQLSPSDATFFIPFSSGSTGKPKAARLSHTSWTHNIVSIIQTGIQEDDIKRHTELSILGLACMPGIMQLYHCILSLDHRIVLAGIACDWESLSLDSDAIVGLMREYEITHSWWTPTDMIRIMNSSSARASFPCSLRDVTIVGSSLPETIARKFMDMSQGRTRIMMIYGSSEAGPVTYGPAVNYNSESPLHEVSAGALLPGVRVRVWDEANHRICSIREEGEIVVHSDMVMIAYVGDKVKSDDRWFSTGDLGFVDERGLLHFVSRKKDIIKVYGFCVSPVEIESLLLSHPDVAEAAVIGVPHQELMEVARAFVVLKKKKDESQRKTVTEQEIADFVASRASKTKHLLGGVVFLDSIPELGFGKINKNALRAM